MITRCIILVIVSLNSFFVNGQCPDFKPVLNLLGEDTLCELVGPSILEYSFQGDPLVSYNAELYIDKNQTWMSFVAGAGDYTFNLPLASKVFLKVSNLDGTCSQISEDTVVVYRRPARQIVLSKRDSICSYTNDYPLLIDLTETKNKTKSFDLFKDNAFFKSFPNVNGADTIIDFVGAGNYSIKNFTDVDNCPIRIRYGNSYRVIAKDSLEINLSYQAKPVADTVFTTVDQIQFLLNEDSFLNNLIIDKPSNVTYEVNQPIIEFKNLLIGENTVKLSVSDECYAVSKTVVIQYIPQTKAQIDSVITICSSSFNPFSIAGSFYQNKFETVKWIDSDGYLGVVNKAYNLDTLKFQQPYQVGTFKFVYSIYNSIADSTTSDTLTLNVIEEPTFQFNLPLVSSDTILTGQDFENLSITISESNYRTNWTTNLGIINNPSLTSTTIEQLDFEGLAKIEVFIEDSLKACPIQKDSIWIDRVQQTIAAVNDTLHLCINQLPDTVFSSSPILEPFFESSKWQSFNSPEELTSDSAFLVLPASVSTGVYYLEYSIENTILSTTKDTLVLLIDALPNSLAIITADYITCSALDTVEANTLTDGNSGIWIDKAENILSEKENDTFNLNPGENVFLWVTSNGACQFIDTSFITINYVESVTEPSILIREIPSGDLFIAVDDTLGLCLKETYEVDFQPNIQTEESFEWLSGQGTNISDPSNNPTTKQQNISIFGTGLKEYILKVEVENGINCPVKYDTLQIAVIDIPDLSSAYLLKEDTVCENTTANKISINEVIWGQKYYWVSSSVLLDFENSNTDSSLYSVGTSSLINSTIDSSAEFSVYAENFCGVSSSQLSDKVLIQLAPKYFSPYLTKNIEVIGKDTLCTNLSASDEVSFQVKKQFNTDSYNWSFPVLGSFESDSVVSISGDKINSISRGNTGFETISVELNNRCGSFGPIDQQVLFQTTENFSFSISLSDGENICPEKTYQLQVNSSFKDSVLLQFNNFSFQERLVLPQVLSIKGDSLLSVSSPQIKVQAEIIDKELCYAIFEDEALLTVTDVGLLIPAIEEPAFVCEDDSIFIKELSSQESLVGKYVWYKNGNVVKQSTDDFITINSIQESGMYKVELTSSFDCESIFSNEVDVQILDKPELSISNRFKPEIGEGIDVFVVENESVTQTLPVELEYSGTENLIYNWGAYSYNGLITESEAITFITNQNTFNPELSVQSYKEDEIIYFLNVSTISGCSDQDSVLVNFIKPFIAPTAFTPNGDNVNDGWMLEGLTQFPDAEVTIFNRWGALVFQKYGGYRDHFTGDNLPMGTYYWIVDFKDNSREPASGVVTILK